MSLKKDFAKLILMMLRDFNCVRKELGTSAYFSCIQKIGIEGVKESSTLNNEIGMA